MKLHIITVAYICLFVVVSLLIAWGLGTYPIFTMITFGLVMFAAFYHLIYTFVKTEQILKDLKK
jgi:hypothetical protein